MPDDLLSILAVLTTHEAKAIRILVARLALSDPVAGRIVETIYRELHY